MVESVPMYTSFSPLSIFLFSGIVQALFLAFVFFANPRGSRQASLLLAAFFVIVAVVIVNGALYQTNLYQDWSFLIGLPLSFQLLVGPFFLWYVKSLIGDFKFRVRDMVHLLPFLLYLVLELSFLFRNDFYKMALMYSWLTNRRDWADYLGRFWYQFGVPLQLGVYLWLVWRAIRRHEVTIRHHFSTIDELTLNWLRKVVIAFAAGLVGVSVGDVLPFFGVQMTWMFLCAPITDTLVVFYLAGVAFLRRPQDTLPAPRPPREPLPEAAVSPTTSEPEPKYGKSSLSEEYGRRVLVRLETLMGTDRPYTDPDLTLAILAGRLKTSRNHLSQVLNQRLGATFYDYINRWRIQESAARLLAPDHQNAGILDIALDCGFKSKSTFNKAFKAHFSVSPSEYRKNCGNHPREGTLDAE